MDLSALSAARQAVAKINKDYKPIADLSVVIDEVYAIANRVREAEAKVAAAESRLAAVKAEQEAAEKAAVSAEARTAAALKTLEEIKAKIASFKV